MKSYLAIVVFYIVSCTHVSNSHSEKKSIIDSASLQTTSTLPISKYMDTLYICKHEGVHTLDTPSDQNPNEYHLPYGERVFVVSKSSTNSNIGNQEERQKNFVEIETDMVYSDTPLYLPEKFLCAAKDIRIIASDICPTYYDSISNNTCVQQKIVHLELVSNTYLTQTLPKKVYLDSNNTAIKKDGRIALVLKLDKDSLLLFDNLSDTDDYVKYEYLGFYSISNSHIIERNLYESTEICFVDAISGNTQIKLGDYPTISPNNKFLIAVYGSPYEEVGSTIELYKIKEGKFEVKFVLKGFKYWSPIVDKDAIYWISDREVIVKVCHSKVYWQANGLLNKDNYQLLKIKW